MPFNAGGEIILGYSDGTEQYELRVPVAPFDATSFLYTGGGGATPVEAGLAETFAALGAVWAPYYDARWALTLEAVYHRASGDGVRLGSVPTVTAVAGASPSLTNSNPAIRRGFSFLTSLGNRHRIRLFGITSDVMGQSKLCSPSTGGFDSRDQALVGYFSGAATGVRCWDGAPFPPSAYVYQRFLMRPFEPAAVGGGILDGNCLTFPLGATICNDAAGVVHVNTPTGAFVFDGTGMTVPGGHRVEQVP